MHIAIVLDDAERHLLGRQEAGKQNRDLTLRAFSSCETISAEMPLPTFKFPTFCISPCLPPDKSIPVAFSTFSMTFLKLPVIGFRSKLARSENQS